MRGFFRMAPIMALASIGMMAAAPAPRAIVLTNEAQAEPTVKRRRTVSASASAQYRRGKRKPPRRVLRTNRVRLSRRVRRKHRRARAA